MNQLLSWRVSSGSATLGVQESWPDCDSSWHRWRRPRVGFLVELPGLWRHCEHGRRRYLRLALPRESQGVLRPMGLLYGQRKPNESPSHARKSRGTTPNRIPIPAVSHHPAIAGMSHTAPSASSRSQRAARLACRALRDQRDPATYITRARRRRHPAERRSVTGLTLAADMAGRALDLLPRPVGITLIATAIP